MIGIVVSRADSASVAIGDELLEVATWEESVDESRPDAKGGGTVFRTEGFELREFEAFHLNLSAVASAFDDPDCIVFVSRHSGETGALLTAHFPGNFGPAEYGGEDRELPAACAGMLPRVLEAFETHAPAGYDVGMECTHHGPSSVGVPAMFIELGSGEDQWGDPAGARAVAETVLDLVGTPIRSERTIVGFGGSHYAPRFQRIVQETPWAVGHIAADWALEAMGDPDAPDNREVISQAFECTGTPYALVDGDYPDLEAVIADLGYRVVSETWLRAVGKRPLDLVERLEEAFGTVDEGLRFGELVSSSFEVIDLPTDLLAEAQGIDHEQTRSVIENHTIAFETKEAGTLAAGRAAVESGDTRHRIVKALAGVLENDYDMVSIQDAAVVAEKAAFDPALARDLGVPEGPKFGTLAEGDPVEVGDREIAPADVTSHRREIFDI